MPLFQECDCSTCITCQNYSNPRPINVRFNPRIHSTNSPAINNILSLSGCYCAKNTGIVFANSSKKIISQI